MVGTWEKDYRGGRDMGVDRAGRDMGVVRAIVVVGIWE